MRRGSCPWIMVFGGWEGCLHRQTISYSAAGSTHLRWVVSEYAVVQAQWPNDRAGRSPRLPTRRRTEIHSVPEAVARLICVSKHLPVRLERRSRLFSPFLKQSRIVLQL